MSINLPRALVNWFNNEWVWIILFLVFIFLIRLPLTNVTVINWDESVYFTIAQDIANGGVPYKTSWDTKGPFLFFAFVPIMLLFDNHIASLRIYTTFYLMLSVFFLYLVARRLFHGFTRLVPPLVYGLFFITPDFGGLASNGELFMMLPVILALYSYVCYEKKGNIFLLFLVGLLSSVAFFIKGTAIFSVLVFPIFILVRSLQRESRISIALLKESVYYSLGVSIPFIFLNYYFWRHGSLYDFYYTYFTVNSRYLAVVPIRETLSNSLYFLSRTIIVYNDVISLASIAAAVYLVTKLIQKKYGQLDKSTVFFILTLSLLSFIGVIWGRRMFPHYYLQMGLSYSLLIALGISTINLERRHIQEIIIFLIVLFMIQSPVLDTISGIKANDEYWYESRYSYEVADYIRNNTTADETILVIGGQPIIYVLSDRRAPTKHFWWTKHQDIMQKILGLEYSVPNDLNNNKPKYIAFYDGNHKELVYRLPYLEKFKDENYTLEKNIGGYKLYVLNK